MKLRRRLKGVVKIKWFKIMVGVGLLLLLVGCVETEVRVYKDGKPIKEGTILNLGEAVNNGMLEVKVLSAKKDYGYHDTLGFYEDAGYGYRYLIVTVEARNIGKREVYIDPDKFVVSDENNYFYEVKIGSLIENELLFTKILPNQRIKGKLVFKIPEKAKILVNYNFGDMFSKPFIVSWKIN